MRCSVFFLIACSSAAHTGGSTEVPQSFFGDKVLTFNSSLVRGPGLEAIVIPDRPADVYTTDERIRVVDADGTTVLFEGIIAGRDDVKKTYWFEITSAGVGSLQLAGIGGESGRPAQISNLRYDDGQLIMDVTLWDRTGERWDFVESLHQRPAGEPTPLVADTQRYSLLTVGSYVIRPDVSQGMDWYASRETPEDALADLGIGVEAWNRYFHTFGEDRLHFRGYLPEDVVVGDPRFNVIVMSDLNTGAAYESQGYDPYSGLQSHSLIFIPRSWYFAGSNSREAERLPLIPSLLPLSREQLHTWQRTVGGLPRPPTTMPRFANFTYEPTCALQQPQATDFGPLLVRAVTMHEVGHALGLGHNFRASSTANVALMGTPDFRFSDSIMDYNIYAFQQRYLFNDAATSDGPLLPYDAQAIDFLFNASAQASTVPPRPMCDESEVFSTGPNVDPTCFPYDFLGDPAVALAVARSRLTHGEARLPQESGRLVTVFGAAEEAAAEAQATIDGGNVPDFTALGEALSAALYDIALFDSISVGNASGTTMRLLSQWEMPEDIGGPSSTIALIRDIGPQFFDGETFVPARYVDYQRQVRAGLLTAIEDAMSVTRTETGALARRYLDGATYQVTVDPSGSALLTAAAITKARVTAVADAARAKLGDVAPINEGVTKANELIDEAILSIAGSLAFDVYWTLPDFPGGAPSLFADAAARIFNAASALASDRHAYGDARVGAIYTMAWLYLTRPYADGAPAQATREAAITAARDAAVQQMAELSQKRVTDGYLNKDELDLFDALNVVASIADQVLPQ